jgi:Mg2+ transporter MgtE
VRGIDGEGVLKLAAARDHLPTAPLEDDAVFLRRDILDKQVVDIHGRRVVRVNDLQLARIDGDLRLVGADIGMAGLLRRLSLERPARAMAASLRRALPERVIPWNYVEGIETEWTSVRLSVSHRRLRELPGTDIADILAQLDPRDREHVLESLDDETVADTLPHLEEDVQADVIRAFPDARASDIMEMLPPDDAADVLGDLPEEHAERILGLMEPDEAEDVRELLRYDDDTAGGLMTPEFVAVNAAMTADEAVAVLREAAPDAETVYYLYVTDAEGRLEGVLSLRDLITAAPETPIAALTRRDVVRAHVADDQETVANELTHYHLLAMPVVDDAGVLLGIVTVDDALDVLHEEADEDLARVAGAWHESDELASWWDEVRVRAPWLVASAAAGLVGVWLLVAQAIRAQDSLPALLALLPLLLLPGTQLGGQGAGIAQAALADDESPREIVTRLAHTQWPVGLLLAVIAAALAVGFTLWLDHGAHTLAVGVVVWGVLMAQMLLGGLLPLLLHRMRLDPVLVSRPALAALALLLGLPLLAQVL